MTCPLNLNVFIYKVELLQGKANYGSISFTLTFASCCFRSLKGYCPYIMACHGEPCPSAWMLNQNVFVQDPVHLWMATGRKKLTHLLPEAGHSRRYLQDWWPFRFLCPIKEPGIQTPGRWLFWDISCHLLDQLAFQKSCIPGLNAWSLGFTGLLWAERAWYR